MKYMGSKNRIAKYILPLMLYERKPEQVWVEPFVGGANMIDKVGGKRIGADNNVYLIALLKYMQEVIPFTAPHISEEEYKHIKENKCSYPDWLVGYVGFNLSFAAKFFGGYRRDRAGVRDYQNEAQQNLRAQQNLILDVDFRRISYDELFIPEESFIYCDPPYAGATGYNKSFDHIKFWDWCREMSSAGHTVFISEYNAPPDFVCVWEKSLSSNLTVLNVGRNKTEKLFKGG